MFVIHRSSAEELKAHLVNLFLVAAADGRISRDEFELLFQLGRKLGFSDQELARITESHDHIEAHLPDTLEERVQHLYDLISMVLADHKIDPREVDLCQKIAVHYGIEPSIVTELVQMLIEASSQEKPSPRLLEDIEVLLKA
jgi:uncharacterized tellurite resistance protein B-like protein